jgi:hypothetical protein
MKDLNKDQQERRAVEIAAAARRYVRDCAANGAVIDIDEWGQVRWRRDGIKKRRAMIDALVDEVRNGPAVVDVWRRFEVPGVIARTLIGARSYGDLYRRLRDKGMEPGFRPAEVARWAVERRITKERLIEIFGLEEEVEAFIEAWTMGVPFPPDET